MGDISKNFSYSEFEDSAVAKKYGINNRIPSAEVRTAIDRLVWHVLQPLRDAYGKSLHINSGYRCKELNEHKEIGGVEGSQHRLGEAADIACTTPYKLATLALRLRLPFDQMILYPNFVHFSHKAEGAQRGQVLYNRRYNGKKIKP